MRVKLWYASDQHGKHIVKEVETDKETFLCIKATELANTTATIKQTGDKSNKVIDVPLDQDGFGSVSFIPKDFCGFQFI